MVHILESADGTQCQMHVSEEFEITLQENPTAGFRWILTNNGEPICILLTDRFFCGSRLGQPGRRTWQFKILLAGSTTIQLSYARSWKPQVQPTRTFTLHLCVTDPAGSSCAT
jgi:predicted secreted protein